MPFCENCSKFHDNDAVNNKGECPSCGIVIAKPKKAPWHFKLLIVASVIYLTYRLIQVIVWIAHAIGH